ncbi:UNVERIFIED_CONTAM: hypothetical protein PYX00_007140 [Menopon gallinae]|uniref:Uncharacterized protein n=1 Tax=Menopon gallinae TaxID=328185 RepID=A0AAW2HHR6_9NEOP
MRTNFLEIVYNGFRFARKFDKPPSYTQSFHSFLSTPVSQTLSVASGTTNGTEEPQISRGCLWITLSRIPRAIVLPEKIRSKQTNRRRSSFTRPVSSFLLTI